jgi:prepilin-type N-terminal cleavage/methylation domain-containing protein
VIVRGKQSWPGSGVAGGFSLIEMLLVLVVIGVVAVLLNSEFTHSSRERALEGCRRNLQMMYLALSIYEKDNNGAFPFWQDARRPAQPLSLLVPKSTTTTEIFICPGSKGLPLPEGTSFAGGKISYAYYMGRASNDASEILVSDAQVDAAPKSRGQQIFSEDGQKPGNNHGKAGGNLLACGGDVTTSGPRAARDVRYPPSVRMLNPP